jgi:hypothetical protein
MHNMSYQNCHYTSSSPIKWIYPNKKFIIKKRGMTLILVLCLSHDCILGLLRQVICFFSFQNTKMELIIPISFINGLFSGIWLRWWNLGLWTEAIMRWDTLRGEGEGTEWNESMCPLRLG